MTTANIEMPVLTAKDFASDQDVRWCPGCGDYAILNQVRKVAAKTGLPAGKIRYLSRASAAQAGFRIT